MFAQRGTARRWARRGGLLLGLAARVGVLVLLAALSLGALPRRGEAGGCRMVMAQTECDACKNACCADYHAHMEACRTILFLCRLAGDDVCAGYVLCVLEAEHDFDICNAMCELDWPDC